MVKSILKPIYNVLPLAVQRWCKRLYGAPPTLSARVRLGIGLEPLSYVWGADREGMEIARYYLERLFLEEFRKDIKGHCLEFATDLYTSSWGDPNGIKKVDILNIEDGIPETTIQADLTRENKIPSNSFDCIICTHVLHIIYELDKFIAELHRVLRPGGVLLVAVPQTSMCDPGWKELWRFTEEGLATALARAFGSGSVTLRAYGNSLTSAGQLRGLTASEFSQAELHHHDTRFAVEICARAVKAG